MGKTRNAIEVVRASQYTPVTESGCWIWTGAVSDKGYGKILCRTAPAMYAHRAFYADRFGPIPDGMFVCHKCDTPPCVNPDHLFLGTNADNMADRKRKGRYNNGGEQNSRALLTVRQVLAIRQASGTHGALGKQYGVSKSTIRDIRIGKNWANVA